jgi:hypothetical protein
VLIAPHFQQVNHVQSPPMYDCAPHLKQVTTNWRLCPSASLPADGGLPLPNPPSPAGGCGPSHFPHFLFSAISNSFLPIS